MNRATLVMSRHPRVALGCVAMAFSFVAGFTRPARANGANGANGLDAASARSTTVPSVVTSDGATRVDGDDAAPSPNDAATANTNAARSIDVSDASATASRAASARPRREVVFALGYGLLVSPRPLLVYGAKDVAASASTLSGITVDVTRRLSSFEYGAHFFTTGGKTDGTGTPAHVLTMAAGELRFFPWTFAALDPWLGTTLGIAVADDYNVWNKTESERAHAVTADVRAAFAGRIEAGARLRVTRYLALSARCGAGWLGFSRGPALEREADAPKYTVRPTDYGRRPWITIGLALELTVPD